MGSPEAVCTLLLPVLPREQFPTLTAQSLQDQDHPQLSVCPEEPT